MLAALASNIRLPTGRQARLAPHGNLSTVQIRNGEVRCVVGHADMAFFEIDDVIIRTRFTLVYVERTSCCNSSVSFDSDLCSMGRGKDLNFPVLALVTACVAAGWMVAVART